jgi:general secretion pathway protein I
MRAILKRPKAKIDRGFTLIEVIIAVAIIAGALVLILQSCSLGVSMAAESQSLSLAVLLAKEKMAEIGMEGFPRVGEEQGDFGESYPRFTWDKTVAGIPGMGLRRVNLTISWEGKNMEVVTYLARSQ